MANHPNHQENDPLMCIHLFINLISFIHKALRLHNTHANAICVRIVLESSLTI
eukprot:c35964_g1_i1 orf=85-243(+)